MDVSIHTARLDGSNPSMQAIHKDYRVSTQPVKSYSETLPPKQDQLDGLVGKEACHHASWPKFNPRAYIVEGESHSQKLSSDPPTPSTQVAAFPFPHKCKTKNQQLKDIQNH